MRVFTTLPRSFDCGFRSRADLTTVARSRPLMRCAAQSAETVAREHAVAHQLGPEVLHLLRLREEAVAADIEAVAAMLDGARDASYVLRILLDDAGGRSVFDELIRGGKARGARTEDDYR